MAMAVYATAAKGQSDTVAVTHRDFVRQRLAPLPRFNSIRMLQKSLFGEVHLAYDALYQRRVAVKISQSALITSLTTRQGLTLSEDVRREARLLQWLHGAVTVDPSTCGLSTSCLESLRFPNNLQRIAKGRQYSVRILEQFETHTMHFLVAEYIGGGELFDIMDKCGTKLLAFSQARQWFHDLCLGVQFLHGASIAHMDVSLENACLDAETGVIKLIDFGLASRHPLQQEQGGNCSSPHLRLVSGGDKNNIPSDKKCTCRNCSVSDQVLLRNDVAIQACLKDGVPLEQLRYLCRPTCLKVAKVGKAGYMSPEMFSGHCFDAYKCDIFALGIVLYSLLTSRPPWTVPHKSDGWFNVIYSGRWLDPDVRVQEYGVVYSALPSSALHLINLMLKPQHLRPTIDQVLASPFFSEADLHPSTIIRAQSTTPLAHATAAATRQITV